MEYRHVCSAVICSITFASYGAVIWDSGTQISGTITQDVVISDGTQNELADDTTILADNQTITVTIAGDARLGAAHGETLKYETQNTGDIRIEFQPGAHLLLRGNLMMRIPRSVTINLGNSGTLRAMEQASIRHENNI